MLAALPTQASKVPCCVLPALSMPGRTLIVTPRCAWFKGEFQRVSDLGVWAADPDSPGQTAAALHAIADHRMKTLCMSAERLAEHPKLAQALTAWPLSLMVIDDAHELAGPALAALGRLHKALGQPTLLALTTEVSAARAREIEQRLDTVVLQRMMVGIYRAQLSYAVEPVDDAAMRLRRAVAWVQRTTGAAVIHAGTAAQAEQIHEMLVSAGESAVLCHEALPARLRQPSLQAFNEGRARVAVVTTPCELALDRGDVRLVVHLTLPGGLDVYQRETHVAGRDGMPAHAVLLDGARGAAVAQRLAPPMLPTRVDLERVIALLREPDGALGPWTTRRLQAALGLGQPVVEAALQLLRRHEVVVAGRGHSWGLSELGRQGRPLPLSMWLQRHADDVFQRCEALERLVFFARTSQCRWKIVLDFFDEEVAFTSCGVCDNCVRRHVAVAREPAGDGDGEAVEAQEVPRFKRGQPVAVPRHGWGRIHTVEGEMVTVEFLEGGRGRFMADYVRPLSPQALRFAQRLLPSRVSALLRSMDNHPTEGTMTHSNLLGLDDVSEPARPGHGVGALGPSDSSDSASDLAGFDIDAAADEVGADPELMGIGGQQMSLAEPAGGVREAYDILPDRVVDQPDEEVIADPDESNDEDSKTLEGASSKAHREEERRDLDAVRDEILTEADTDRPDQPSEAEADQA